MIVRFPILPPKPNQRHFRMHLKDKTWIKIKDRIYTPKQLQEKIDRFKPTAVYVSIGRFLNPTTLSQMRKFTKPLNRWADNIFLGCDFIMDFDEKNIEHLKKALETLIKIGYLDFTAVETGRGFHLWVHDFEKKLVQKEFKNLWEREEYYKGQMVKLSTKLWEEGIIFDKPISEDTRRIIKVWNTWDKKNNFFIKLIDLKTLNDAIPSREASEKVQSLSPPSMMIFDLLGRGKFRGLQGLGNLACSISPHPGLAS